MAVLSDSPLVDLSPAMPSTVDSDQTMNPCQNGIGTSNANQATFIPIHLNNTPLCAPSSHQPPEPDCSAISPRTSSKSVFHQSVLGFKTNRFSLDVSLDLSTKYGQDALKSVIQMLHQLADGQDSYD
jgi:hypothetical protein